MIKQNNITFTLEEVLDIIGSKVDFKAKYETEDTSTAKLEWEENDSDSIFALKVESYANQVSDITRNTVIDEMRNDLYNLMTEKRRAICQSRKDK